MRVSATGKRDGAAIRNRVDQLEHVTAADGGDQPPTPCWLHVPVNDAPHFIVGTVVGLVALEPLVRHRLEAVGCRRPWRAGFSPLPTRVRAACHASRASPNSIAGQVPSVSRYWRPCRRWK